MAEHSPSNAFPFTLHCVEPQLQHEIEQFLYAEAALLDGREWRRWLALFTEDARYRMPLRSNVGPRQRAQEFSTANESALFDEDKASLDMRIRRLETGMAWAEEPPSRTRHMVTNVRITPLGDVQPRRVQVDSCFHVYRSRLERQVDQLIGERTDVLLRTDAAWRWQIEKREIRLDQATVLANNLSMFF